MDTNLGCGDDAVATLRGVPGSVFSKVLRPVRPRHYAPRGLSALPPSATSWRDCRLPIFASRGGLLADRFSRVMLAPRRMTVGH